jgi:hypothetical protein
MSQIRRFAYLLVAVNAVAAATMALWKPAPFAKFVSLTTNQIPRDVGQFSAPEDLAIDDNVQRQLASATIISRQYTNNAEGIGFNFIAGTDRNALHDPRSCLIGSGMQLVDFHSDKLPGTMASVATCRAVDTSGHEDLDMAYMYYVDGKVINSPTQIRLAMLRGLLLGQKNSPAYFLEYSMPVPHGEPIAPQGHADLIAFAAQMWTALRPEIARS